VGPLENASVGAHGLYRWQFPSSCRSLGCLLHFSIFPMSHSRGFRCVDAREHYFRNREKIRNGGLVPAVLIFAPRPANSRFRGFAEYLRPSDQDVKSSLPPCLPNDALQSHDSIAIVAIVAGIAVSPPHPDDAVTPACANPQRQFVYPHSAMPKCPDAWMHRCSACAGCAAHRA
jgi:hypothetical protein